MTAQPLASPEEALAVARTLVRPSDFVEVVPLAGALDRILAEAVAAAGPSPRFDNSAVDGYALRTADAEGGRTSFVVVERIAAGCVALRALAPGQAVRIFTGAPLPPGADTVMMQEHVRRVGARIRLDRIPKRGENVRRAGEDFVGGAAVLEVGRRIGPREIAAAAAAGARSLTVFRPPRVALLTTGDEVAPAGTALDAAGVWDVNSPMLAAAISKAGGAVVGPEICRDEPAGIADRLRALAAEADLVVTTGGVSVGDEDHLRAAVGRAGGQVVLAGVAMKPGKPVSFGRVGAAGWLGLPGNPISAFVTWSLFGAAMVAACQGRIAPSRARRVAIEEAILRKPGRTEYRLAQLVGVDFDGRQIVSTRPVHSGRVTPLAAANGLVRVPPESVSLKAGTLVDFLEL